MQRDVSEVFVRRGTCYLRQKDYDAAIADLSEALQFNQNNATAFAQRGIAYWRDGFPQLAKADLHEALLLNPRHIEALLCHARVCLDLGDTARALRDAETAVRTQADCQEGYEIMARCYVANGDYAKATNCARKLAGDRAEQIGHLIEVAQESAATEEDLAAGEGPPQRVVLKPTTSRPNDAQAHFDQGIASMNLRQWDKAVDQFTMSLNLFQDDSETYYQRGMAFLEQGFPDTAIKDFNQASRLEPGFVPAVRGRAHAWFKLGDPLAAINDATRALALYPEDAATHLLRARAYLEILKFTRTLADLEEAEKLDPQLAGEAGPLAARALKGRAVENLHARKWDAAIGDFQEALRLNPAAAGDLGVLLAEAYRHRAVDHREHGRVDAALADLAQAIRLEPDAADNFRLSGETYLKAGKWQEAIDQFDRAAELAPMRAFRVRPRPGRSPLAPGPG